MSQLSRAFRRWYPSRRFAATWLLAAAVVGLSGGTSIGIAPGQEGHRLVANEGKQLFIFDAQGNVEWSRTLAAAPHDLHRLPSGNLLTHQGTEVIEIDPRKDRIVWKFDAAKLASGTGKLELHSIAPLPENLVMIALSGERKIFEVDRRGDVEHTIELKVDRPNPHRDTRLVRPLDNGHYLVAHEGDGAVREYDRDGTVVWEYEIPLFGKPPAGGHGPESFGNAVFSALRLANGNTLIGTGNGHSVLEVNPAGEIVWKVEQRELPEITLAWVTTLEVHPDGSLVIGNCHAGPGQPQLVKINRDKEVLWTFANFQQLGNSVSNSQLLDTDHAKVIR